MKVLMKKDVRKVGNKGEVVEVSDGYGANFLIPNGFAVLYTVDASKQHAVELEQEKVLQAQKKKEAEQTVEKLKTITLNFEASEGRDKNMIGTISFKKIFDKLEEEYSIKVTKSQIVDKDLIINGFGLTEVKVELYKGVIGYIRVMVSHKDKK